MSSTGCSFHHAGSSARASVINTSATSRIRRSLKRFRAWSGLCSARATPNSAVGDDALLATLGRNARLIGDLVPELARIVGDQPPAPELPPQDAQRRFQLLLRRFIGVFAR